jgi:hypothetical protein
MGRDLEIVKTDNCPSLMAASSPERAGFELSGDFVNGQQVIRKRQRVQK